MDLTDFLDAENSKYASELTARMRNLGYIGESKKIRVTSKLVPTQLRTTGFVDTAQVTRQCQGRYFGTYVRPAAMPLPKATVNEMVVRMPWPFLQRELQILLIDNLNEPSDLDPHSCSLFNKYLAAPIEGVYYRMAADAQGFRNLWVVHPTLAPDGAAIQTSFDFEGVTCQASAQGSGVSEECQQEYRLQGVYVQPARIEPAGTVAREMLKRVGGPHARKILESLICGENNPCSIHGKRTIVGINQALVKPINGIFHRLAANDDGLRNIWVVRPHAST